MEIKDFFSNQNGKIFFTIVWTIIGLLIGYLKIGHLEEISLKKFNKFQKFKIIIKPVLILLGLCILFLEIFPLVFNYLI